MIPILVVAGYGASAFLAYGITLGYFQQKYYSIRSRNDVVIATFFAALGPIGLAMSFFSSDCGKYGLQFLAEGEAKRDDDYERFLARRASKSKTASQ